MGSDLPDWMPPMLATLSQTRLSDDAWIYERKLDGVRALAYKAGSAVKLFSRSRKRIDSSYPEVKEALERQDKDFVVDGEIVAFEGEVTSFSRLQGRMQIKDAKEAAATGIEVFYYVFDVLWAEGEDVRGLAHREKTTLRSALAL